VDLFLDLPDNYHYDFPQSKQRPHESSHLPPDYFAALSHWSGHFWSLWSRSSSVWPIVKSSHVFCDVIMAGIAVESISCIFKMAPGSDGNNSLAALIIGDYSTVYFMAFSLHSPRLCAVQMGNVIAVIIGLLARKREGFLFTFHATQFYWQFGSIVWRPKCVWNRFLTLCLQIPESN